MRLHIIGDRARFDADITADLARAERATAANTRLNLVIALSYGARDGDRGRRPRRRRRRRRRPAGPGGAG